MAEKEPDLFDLMMALRGRRDAYALATVVETVGSASATPGAKAVIARDGVILAGWVGGGCAEAVVRQAALTCLREARPTTVELDLNDEVLGTGMPCGGSMRVYVEPVLPPPRLWLLGHGRVAECLCRFGATPGFRVIVDETPAPDQARFPDAAEIIGDDDGYEQLTPGPEDAVVVATQHKGDHISTVRALRSPAWHVALIASGKRARLVLEFLRGEGFTDEDLRRVHAPAGLDLGARTPEEIALSVLGEIVMLRRGGRGGPLRDTVSARHDALHQTPSRAVAKTLAEVAGAAPVPVGGL